MFLPLKPGCPGYNFTVGSILVVEPDPVICGQWVTALSEAGHSVLTAMLPQEVLSVIREGGIEAVVIDAHDPCGIIELARTIEAFPNAPPVVLISGSPAAPEISARIGAAAFLTKPCDPAELVAVANRLVGSLRPVRIVVDDPSRPSRPRF